MVTVHRRWSRHDPGGNGDDDDDDDDDYDDDDDDNDDDYYRLIYEVCLQHWIFHGAILIISKIIVSRIVLNLTGQVRFDTIP